MASVNDVYVNGKFVGEIHKNDGYNITICSDVRRRRVLQFLGLLFNRDKPTKITKRMANTLFGTRARHVDWGHLIHEEVSTQIKQVRKGRTKPSALSALLYHLYEHHKCLLNDENAAWDAAL